VTDSRLLSSLKAGAPIRTWHWWMWICSLRMTKAGWKAALHHAYTAMALVVEAPRL